MKIMLECRGPSGNLVKSRRYSTISKNSPYPFYVGHTDCSLHEIRWWETLHLEVEIKQEETNLPMTSMVPHLGVSQHQGYIHFLGGVSIMILLFRCLYLGPPV